MGMFGGARQRALAASNNNRMVASDGLALLDRPAPAFANPALPAGLLRSGSPFTATTGQAAYSGATQLPSNPPVNPWSVPIDGGPMPVAGVRLADTMPKKKGFFAKDGAWRDVLGTLGDALSGKPIYLNAKLQRQQMEREDALLQQKRAWQLEDRDFEASQPEYFMSGRDRVRYNPRTGQAEVVYDGTEDFEQYARTMGLQPGTEEYFTAVQDYVLRGNGPSAYGFDKQLDDYRTENDKRLDDYRTGNRLKVRGQPTWRDRNPPAPRSRAVPRRPRATNAQGQSVEWNGKEWVAAK